MSLTIQVVSSHEQLKAQLRWDIHVWNVLRIFVFLVVVQVLAHLLKYDAVDVLKHATVALGLGEVVCGEDDVSAPILNSKCESERVNGRCSVLVGSNMRLIAPETFAAERRTLNSKPSRETSVTYSVIVVDDTMVVGLRVDGYRCVDGRW